MARILLVQDDLDVRLLMENILLFMEHEVTAVETVTSACSILAGVRFDLVLADLRLADGNGMEIAEKAVEYGTKALIVTGNPWIVTSERLDRFAYLLKPVHPTDLVGAVRRCLDDGNAKHA